MKFGCIRQNLGQGMRNLFEKVSKAKLYDRMDNAPKYSCRIRINRLYINENVYQVLCESLIPKIEN